jgi:hypothetical protein
MVGCISDHFFYFPNKKTKMNSSRVNSYSREAVSGLITFTNNIRQTYS